MQVPNLGREKPPEQRVRHAAVARLAKYFPAGSLGLQLHYRYYFDHAPPDGDAVDAFGRDPWQVHGHTFDVRGFKGLTRHLEVRLSYRFHSQGAAQFWCNTDPTREGRTDCYGPNAPYYVSDPKLGDSATHYPEVKLTWDAHALRGLPFVGWFADGAFDVSYGRFMQSTRWQDAHLLQTGYSLAF